MLNPPVRPQLSRVLLGVAMSALLVAARPSSAQETPPPTPTPAPDTIPTDKNSLDKKGSYGHSMLGAAFNEIPRQRAYLMKGMPRVSFSITTKSRDAQKFFDQAIGQLHGYWYLEASRSFRKVIELDPACPMGYWGLAFINLDSEEKNKEYLAKAKECKGAISEREQMWLDSVVAYVNADPKMPDRTKTRRLALVKAWQEIVDKFPDDIEAKAFLAHQWLNYPNLDPKHTREQTDALTKQVLAANPQHPLHHYRIHLWDTEATEKNALDSAAQCGASSPGIAHMWHMQGHTYTGLRRYADAAYSQEASARVDHAYMMHDRVLPDQIHNYAHNNQWLIENLEYLGRVHDAVDLGKNMIDLPRHPKYNTLNGGSANQGRLRLIETLFCYDLWNDALQLNKQGYIEPGVSSYQNIERLALLADASFATNDTSGGQAYLAELLAIQEANAPDPKADGKESNSSKESKEAKNPYKRNDVDRRQVEEAIAEARAYEAIAANNPAEAGKQLDLAKSLPRTRAARLRLQIGQKDKAEQLARDAVKQSPAQVAPLATLVDALAQNGKRAEALQRFGELRALAAHADIETPLFGKLNGLAQEAGCTAADWRTPMPSPSDIGPRPPLDSLGPFRWSPSAAPGFTLPEATGGKVSLADYAKQGRPVVVIFYLGNACVKCREQLAAFAPMQKEYDKAGISLVAVSADSPAFLKHIYQSQNLKASTPFPLLSDKDGRAFKAFRAWDDFENMPLHGTFIVDGKGLVRWQDTGFEPFMDARFVLDEARRLVSQQPAAHELVQR